MVFVRPVVKRSKPLVARTPLRNKKPLQRKPMRRHHAPGIPPKIRAAVERRSHGLCQAMLEGCTVVATDVHHRKMRSQGGEHTLDNLVHLCHRCHIVGIHHNTGWAYLHGWLVRRDDDPAVVEISGTLR